MRNPAIRRALPGVRRELGALAPLDDGAVRRWCGVRYAEGLEDSSEAAIMSSLCGSMLAEDLRDASSAGVVSGTKGAASTPPMKLAALR